MSKKGFTLIELLAVIVILGILLTISVTSFISISNKQKEKLYESKIEAIEAAGKVYLHDNPTETSVTVSELKNKNYIDDIKDPRTNEDIEGEVSLRIEKRGKNKVYIANYNKEMGNIDDWNYRIDKSSKTVILGSYKEKDADAESELARDVKIYSEYTVTETDSSNDEVKKVYDTVISPLAFSDNKYITSVTFKGNVKFMINNFEALFKGCTNLKSVDFGKVNAKDITSYYAMFEGCSSLTNVDFGSLNTSKVMILSRMFMGCTSLKKIDLSVFAPANVTQVYEMFSGCSSLEEILNIAALNTSNVTAMNSMFYNCSSLKSIDVSSFNTSKVAYFDNMFSHCTSLTSLDISNFDTSNASSVTNMFSNCDNLEKVKITTKKDKKDKVYRQVLNYCEQNTCEDDKCLFTDCDFS